MDAEDAVGFQSWMVCCSCEIMSVDGTPGAMSYSLEVLGFLRIGWWTGSDGSAYNSFGRGAGITWGQREARGVACLFVGLALCRVRKVSL